MAYVPTPLDLVDPADSVLTCFNKVNENFGDIQTVINDLTALLSGGFDYTKTDLIGGASTALDSIDGENLEQGNRALVVKGTNPGQVYIYVLDETAGGVENAPDLIVPDTNAGTKRWVLASSPSRFWNNSTDPTVNSDESIAVKPGDIWKNGANLWVCNSAVAGTASWIRLLKLGTGGTDACAGNDARLSDARPALPHDHVEAEISDLKSYSLSTHNHDLIYSALSHNHSSVYSPVGHDHNTSYAALLHNHDAAYSALGHTHADASSTVKGLIQLAGNLSGSAAAPTVVGIKESGGTSLALGAITDGQFLKRSGSSVVSADPIQDAGGPMDVVGGRIDYVSTTQIQWTFLVNNQIRLYDGAKWVVVNCASVPTAANSATDLNGTALAHSVVYDVFAQYSSATAFSLVFSKWNSSGAGTSQRYSTWGTSTAYKIGDRVLNSTTYYVCVTAHTSGTFATDLSAGKWVSNGSDPGTDFRGLYKHDGVWVSGNDTDGTKRRWLGVIMLVNNAGTPNFADDRQNRYIANVHNRISKIGHLYYNGGQYTFTSTSAREWHAGTGAVRLNALLCEGTDLLFDPHVGGVCTSGAGTMVIFAVNGSNSQIFRYHSTVANQLPSGATYIPVISGYNQFTVYEQGEGSPNYTSPDSQENVYVSLLV